jgi:hypothetical protein
MNEEENFNFSKFIGPPGLLGAIIILIAITLYLFFIVKDLRVEVAEIKEEVFGAEKAPILPQPLGTSNNSEEALPETSEPAEPWLILLSPDGGESFCLGDNVVISWQGSMDIDMIGLYAKSGGGFSTITNLPLSFNERGLDDGSGTYVWDAGKTAGGILSEGFVYQIHIAPLDKDGLEIWDFEEGVSSDYFSLIDCRG